MLLRGGGEGLSRVRASLGALTEVGQLRGRATLLCAVAGLHGCARGSSVGETGVQRALQAGAGEAMRAVGR